MKTSNIVYISLLGLIIGFLMTSLFFSISEMDGKNSTKVSYCHIDSSATIPKYEIMPETTNKYWTDCGQVFFSKNEYKNGDSIQVKTIIIE